MDRKLDLLLGSDQLFLTDGGLETSLKFKQGLELPGFAAFPLLDSQDGRDRLINYYKSYLEIALAAAVGFVFESPTRRASPDWGAKLGYDTAELAELNREGVRMMTYLARAAEGRGSPLLVSGCAGPRSDRYRPDQLMTPMRAAEYHWSQIEAFAVAGADMVTAMTMTNVSEATGFVQAAREAGLPAVVSFTLETDGALPTGQGLADAIKSVDEASNGYPAFFMIDCAHPVHFSHILRAGDRIFDRLKGVRANASMCRHKESDSAVTLDEGDPIDLAARLAVLRVRLPQITLLGGCCGTGPRHIKAIARACEGLTLH